jgi:hypothetical protein
MKIAEWSVINENLAAAVGVSRQTLQSAAAAGKFRTQRVGVKGETLLVSVASIRKWKQAEWRPLNR